jgi:hypothetical protein
MKLTAIAGTFVKIEPVATRKVVRLHIECPIELANDILKSLGGYPDPANAHWVGIALLKEEPQNTLKGGKLAASAGILCTEGAFLQWCDATGADAAADYIRQRCGITSRAHLDHDEGAAREFREMKREYEAWLKVAA